MVWENDLFSFNIVNCFFPYTITRIQNIKFLDVRISILDNKNQYLTQS